MATGIMGIKDCGDLTLYNRATNKPALYINYANSFEISFSSSPVYANKKGKKSIVWDGEMEGTAKLSTQLTSTELFGVIFGSQLISGSQDIYKREVFTVKTADEAVDIKETPKANTVVAFVLDGDGATHEKELTVSVATKKVTLTGAKVGERVAVFYITEKTGQTFKIKGTKDSVDYKLVCVAFGKGYETGGQIPMQIVLPKVAPQSNATISLSSESPSSFDITFDILIDEFDEMLLWDEITL